MLLDSTVTDLWEEEICEKISVVIFDDIVILNSNDESLIDLKKRYTNNPEEGWSTFRHQLRVYYPKGIPLDDGTYRRVMTLEEILSLEPKSVRTRGS